MKSEYSVIIPVIRLEGNRDLPALLKTLSNQSNIPAEVHIVAGDPRQGRAINRGVGAVGSKYVATLDDDSIIDDTGLFKKLVDAMEADDTIGIGGAACTIPKNASELQKRAMIEIPRRFFPVQKQNIDSDMVQHPCLMMRTDIFREIGGEDEDLVRGLDPVLRKKARDAGKRVVIIADTWVYHGLPDSLPKIMKMYYRNGRGSGFALRYYPEKILELSDGFDEGNFVERRPLWFRIARRIWFLVYSLATLKTIRLLTEISYVAGVVKEYLFPAYTLEKPGIESVETSEKGGYPFKLIIHKVKLARK